MFASVFNIVYQMDTILNWNVKTSLSSEVNIERITREMEALIKEDLPFIKKGLPTGEVIEILKNQGLSDKSKLFGQQGKLYTYVYFLNGFANYYYGHLLPSTGYLDLFQVKPYSNGILLRTPRFGKLKKLGKLIQQDKLLGIYQEHKDWVAILKVATVGSLNEYTLSKRSGDIIKISEALHEKKVAEIANRISKSPDKIKFILIAGPSASGKTTFSKRLGVQLAVNGLHPYQISLDDYFVDRDKTPKDGTGEYNFESLNAIDIPFFNSQLIDLLEGKKVELPKFDFTSGKKMVSGKYLQLKENDILIIEGIHGMNPGLMPLIDPRKMFKNFYFCIDPDFL